MTQQYQQNGINLLPAEPIVVQTTSIAPLLVSIDELTEDGQSLWVQLIGGGSDPSAPSTNNYNTAIRTIFTRQAGVVSIGNTSTGLSIVGVPIAIAPAVSGNFAQFSITGPAFPYNHRLPFSKIKF